MSSIGRTGRRAGTAFLALALVVPGSAALASSLRGHSSGRRATAALAGANASRFLQLTGGSETIAAAGSKRLAAGSVVPHTHTTGCGNAKTTPQGWCIRPAGDQIQTLRFPLGLATSADGKQVVVTADSGGPQGLSVIDATNPSLPATVTPAQNLFMGLAVTPAGKIYASGGNADRVFRFQLAGPLAVHEDPTEAEVFPIHSGLNSLADRGPSGSPRTLPAGDGIGVTAYPGNAVLDASANRLYVAGTLAEASGSQTCPGTISAGAPSACSRVTVVDTTNDSVIARIPVGLDAYGLALGKGVSQGLLFVSNWADEAGRGGAGGGTVSVVDLAQGAEVAAVAVGHHPSAVQLNDDGSKLFVADTNDDEIAILDLTNPLAPSVTKQSVKPAVGTEDVGAHPDAFTLSPDGATLFVALAGLNAVELLDGHTGLRISSQPRYIPTGWYPSALAVTGSASSYRLWVANARGDGTAPGYNSSVFLEGNDLGGTVSSIALPSGDESAWTEQVLENDHLDRVADACLPSAGVHKSQVLCPPGNAASPIKHVVYIVTENKTFDQYFGDINQTGGAGFNADPGYLLYGQPVTPNHHALVSQFSLGDNFYSDADVSVTGHSWTAGAIATDHNEKTWHADYDQGLRGTHGGGDPLRPSVGGSAGGLIAKADDELQDPEGGYVFENFVRNGHAAPPETPGAPLTMAIYGERTARESGDMSAYKAKWTQSPGHSVDWKEGDLQYFDTCRARQFIDGVAPDGPVPNGTQADPYFADCQGRGLDPQFTLADWTAKFQAGQGDVMPNFIYMSLPVNHTLGTNVGNPTPASMVADNDYAIGLIVDALSHSPFWASTVVMQTEDDTQVAGDHISPLRDYVEMESPWVRQGANHQRGSMPALLRTIEQIFNLPPVALTDRVAEPLHEAFVEHLNDGRDPAATRYDAIRPAIPFAINEPGAVGSAESASMDFSTVDRINENLLNAILYADARHTALLMPPKFKR